MSIAHLIAVPPTVIRCPAPANSHRSDTGTVEFTVVVPFRNPGARLREAVQRISATLFAQGISFEIIAVSGDSTDGSADTLDDLPRTLVVVDPDVLDRGAAMQRGLVAARAEWVGFVDVDADTEVDPYELAECFHAARECELLAA
jgi:hypothetical protein